MRPVIVVDGGGAGITAAAARVSDLLDSDTIISAASVVASHADDDV